MEQNKMPIIAKKFWKIVRVVYYMLRKGISKAKLLADLNIMMKRGKLAGKSAVHNLVFHHHHSAASAAASAAEPEVSYPVPLNEYEFSCSKTPTFRLPFHLNKRKHSSHSHSPPQPSDADLFAAAMEIVGGGGGGEASSPALPGFGRTPVVRQLRITDSPFPLKEFEADSHVDEAAEKFIIKFYKDLKQQN